MYQKILVAYDGSFMSREAIENAKDYANLNKNVEIHIISILETTGPVTNMQVRKSMLEDLKQKLQPQMDEIEKEFIEKGIKVITKLIAQVDQESPGKVICDYAKKNNIDVIFMGSRGLGKVKSLFLGSVSKYVVNNTDAHVFILK